MARKEIKINTIKGQFILKPFEDKFENRGFDVFDENNEYYGELDASSINPDQDMNWSEAAAEFITQCINEGELYPKLD